MVEENKNNKQRAQEKLKLTELYGQFKEQYPTIEHIWYALLQHAIEALLIFCRECGASDLLRSKGSRRGKCLRCGLWQSLTAGGFLSNVRRPGAWLFALNLLASKQFFSSELFHDVVGVSQSTASHIFKTIGYAVGQKLDEDTTLVKSSAFKEVFFHRSRETPKGKHPAEEELFFGLDDAECQVGGTPTASVDDQTMCDSALSNVDSAEAAVAALKHLFATLSGDQQKIASLLSRDPVHFDVLMRDSGLTVPQAASSLTLLELAGVASRMPGDRYVLAEMAPLQVGSAVGETDEDQVDLTKSQIKAVSLFLMFIRRVFSGLSRKWLHHYLSMFSCYLDEDRWDYIAISTACFEAGYIGGSRLLDYVSPRLVKLPN